MSKRKIVAKDIISSINASMTNQELMEAYNLTVKGLESVFIKLVEANLLERSKVFGRLKIVPPETATVIRKIERKEIFVPLRIETVDEPPNSGVVINLTSKGLGTKGLAVIPDKRYKLRVLADEFFQLDQFTLDARCRWVLENTETSEAEAGFEITSITEQDLERLQNLLETFDYMFRGC